MRRKTRDYWIRYIRSQDDSVNSGLWSAVYEVVNSVECAVIIIFVVFAFAFRAVGVVGDSMKETLHDGDWLAVSSINTRYERGDIVIVTHTPGLDEPIVKRIVALGGDTVDIDYTENSVIVNGKKTSEPYIAEAMIQPNMLRTPDFNIEFPLTVPEGCVFVLGDNRNNSVDSRSEYVGCIDERYVLGKAVVRLLPFDSITLFE